MTAARDDHQAQLQGFAEQREPSGRRVSGALKLYDLGWRMIIPALQRNRRLREGYDQRRLACWRGDRADLWIHGASAGEAYLAASLIEKLQPAFCRQVLLTTLTSQGMGILSATASRDIDLRTAYFPFDRPTLMRQAVDTVRPRVAVLLETELWPGFLAALKTAGVPAVIVNGRLTLKSLRGYSRWSALWHHLRPARVLAVSDTDARRYAALFGPQTVEVMHNMKFDRLLQGPNTPVAPSVLAGAIPEGSPFLVLGSIRSQEEPLVAKMIPLIRQRNPGAIIGLFPRHMHRLGAWRKRLDDLFSTWCLRSQLTEPAPAGTVVLWDTFGELSAAYALCQACFVGGSLAPLGGQNFLEPLAQGVMPVIGPHWENFRWVGQEILAAGLVRQVRNWKEAADVLSLLLEAPPPRHRHRSAAAAYLSARAGGTARACRVIESFLSGNPNIGSQ